MNLRDVPPRVRAHIYLFYAGMAIAGLGLVGFILSFGQVGSSSQALIDVHDDTPVVAYASIFAWVIGLGTMWYGRRTLDSAVREKMRENRMEALADSNSGPGEASGGDTTGA